MRHEVIMPALGMAQKTGLIAAWRKTVGEAVKADDILMEVETDKATMEVEAGRAGYVARLIAETGIDVPVGDVVAVITSEMPPAGEQPASSSEPDAPPARTGAPVAIAPTSPVAAPALARAGASSPAAPADRARASPKARRLAEERGIDLSALAVALDRPGPIHVADLDAAPTPSAVPMPSAAPRAPSPALGEIEARVPAAALDAMLERLRRDVPEAGRGRLLVAFAAGALREATGGDGASLCIRLERDGETLAYSDPDRTLLSRLRPAEENATPLLILRDLTGTPLVLARFGEEPSPVLVVSDAAADELSLRLSFDPGRLDPSAAMRFVAGLAARIADPLRQLL